MAAAAVAAGALSALLAAPASAAIAACPGVGPVSTVVRDGGFLESSAFDDAGRLVYDDWVSGAVRVLDAPGTRPRGLGRLTFAGGIAAVPGGGVVAAQGNSGAALIGGASVYRIDPVAGTRQRIASGLVGANGLARAADGTIYTSDVGGGLVDRIAPDGTVTRSWWRNSGGPNGLALSADGRTLFANLSLGARVVAIDTQTRASRTVYRAPGFGPLPDGLAIDAAGRLYVALFVAGEIHRVDPATGTACRLARGLSSPTSIALPTGNGPFDPASAYVTTSGAIKRIAGAVGAGQGGATS